MAARGIGKSPSSNSGQFGVTSFDNAPGYPCPFPDRWSRKKGGLPLQSRSSPGHWHKYRLGGSVAVPQNSAGRPANQSIFRTRSARRCAERW